MNSSEIKEMTERIRKAFEVFGMSLNELSQRMRDVFSFAHEPEGKVRKQPTHQTKLVFKRERIDHQVIERKPRHLNKKIIR
ncbi:hypothetical protein ACWNS2_13845 [Planococcus plakortidis]